MHARRALTTATLALSLGSVTACSLGGGTTDGAAGPGGESRTVVVATHDSWVMSKKVLQEFTAKTGYTVKVEPS